MNISTRIRIAKSRVRLSSLSTKAVVVRNDWTKQEIQNIYDLPFMELVHRAAAVHRLQLLSIIMINFIIITII